MAWLRNRVHGLHSIKSLSRNKAGNYFFYGHGSAGLGKKIACGEMGFKVYGKNLRFGQPEQTICRLLIMCDVSETTMI